MLAGHGRYSQATSLRLIDFGLAQRLCDPWHGLSGVEGTKSYMAPDIFREPHGSLASLSFSRFGGGPGVLPQRPAKTSVV